MNRIWPGFSILRSVACGLLHLDHHVGGGEDLGRRIDDPGAGALVLGVVHTDAGPGAGLDHNLVAVVDRLAHAHGRHADPVLVDLDLLWHADPHPVSPVPPLGPDYERPVSAPRTRLFLERIAFDWNRIPVPIKA